MATGFTTVRSDYPGRDASLKTAIEEGNKREITREPITWDTLKEHNVIINPDYPDQPVTIGADLPPRKNVKMGNRAERIRKHLHIQETDQGADHGRFPRRDMSTGDPRSQIVAKTCYEKQTINESIAIPNFLQTMTKVGTLLRSSHSGTASTGVGADSMYELGECYGDLSADDCVLCYAEARTVLPTCFPERGQIFLDGCFMRIQNYSFYEESFGAYDRSYCGNTSVGGGFQDSVRRAVSNAVMDAPQNSDYFAREVLLSGTENVSAYVLADCWNTLNLSSCADCLQRASESMLKCLPSSEGRALYTGCFMRYSNTNFLNPESARNNNGGGSATSQVIQLICENQQENNRSEFIPNFLQGMEDINVKMQTSHTATVVTGTGLDANNVLSQCYGDLSTSECLLCIAEARTTLPSCLPNVGGRVYLRGCFMRFRNYTFFGELTGEKDRTICENNTQKSDAFGQSASKAVLQAVETAPNSQGRHAGTQAIVTGSSNESAYATGDCWSSLDVEACRQCLQTASTSMLGCLPWSGGYALYTGCYMRYSDTILSNPDGNDQKRRSKGKTLTIVISVSSVVAFIVASILALFAWKHRIESKRKQASDDTKLLDIVISSSLNFKYSTIEKATSSFGEANKLGQGGFGTVYKGVLPNGREIAAKRLFVNHQHRAGDFYHEVNIISSVNHKNLVKLVGFSCLGPESVLIYEYLPNKSLDHFIFDAVKGKELNWEKRFLIIVGTAEGLAYLHENSKTRIIHRDIKAANILLDSRLCAKIADFGLARSYEEDKNHISTGIAGTLGYMAPEYIAHGQLTEKVDVYSFGVLILEVVTGKPNRAIHTSEYIHNLVSLVWEQFNQGSVEELFDPNLMLQNHTDNDVKKEIQSVVHIGLLCTQEVPSLRPTMSMALQMLSKNIKPLPMPTYPPFTSHSNIQLNEFLANLKVKVSNTVSAPTVSDSSFGPRDIKAANILLDSRLCAKIADFGLARSYEEDKNHISTGIAGTLGYMAPEYIAHGQLTEKVDVYSFGVLILEVVTGKPNRAIHTSEYIHNLVSLVWEQFNQGSVEELFDPNLMLQNHTDNDVKKEIQSVVHIGLLCTQEVPSLRPTMSMALQMLSKNIKPLPMPTYPPFTSHSNIQLNEFLANLKVKVSNTVSAPTVSDSSFGPR
nr:cysteine-rich receptor-like protein kinase 2 [Tanacetum cinerariifolium]